MTLILAAFNGELAATLNSLHDKEKCKISLGRAEIYYTRGMLAGTESAAAVTGVGKINSYISTSEIIRECSPDRIIYIGIAGAIDPGLRIGDVVISDRIIQYDMDMWCRTTIPGSTPGPAESVYAADENMIAAAEASVKGLQIRGELQGAMVVGCTGSADVFMTPEMQEMYAEVLTDEKVLAVDMEGFAAAAAAAAAQVPFAQIRIISDEADGTKSPTILGFREVIREASEKLALIIGVWHHSGRPQ
ncbi:MAG: 5'-methylthioadenosine/S-adenosylhomocysteine nucleosidase [Phycisphaerae bacterium]|nr:5'-methylthioadenosine/S-adenosylhomocysteine nucleosidase [Phycisphaerae bacterium]